MGCLRIAGLARSIVPNAIGHAQRRQYYCLLRYKIISRLAFMRARHYLSPSRAAYASRARFSRSDFLSPKPNARIFAITMRSLKQQRSLPKHGPFLADFSSIILKFTTFIMR